MSALALKELNHVVGLRPSELSVMTLLSKRHQPARRVALSTRAIATQTGLSASTVKRTVSTLEKKGHVRRHAMTRSGKRTCNEFELLFVGDRARSSTELAGSVAGSNDGSNRTATSGHDDRGYNKNKYPPLPPTGQCRAVGSHAGPARAIAETSCSAVTIRRGTKEWEAWRLWAIKAGRRFVAAMLDWGAAHTWTVPSRFPPDYSQGA